MDVDNLDDPLVGEVKVFLSKTLSEGLYVFQYNSKPSNRPFDPRNECVGAKVKPLQQKVELEISIDSNSQNYNYGKGEQLILNMKSNNEAIKSQYGDILDKQLLTSTKAVSSTTPFSIGFFRKGEIHLTPLHSILQLKPSFNFLDAADSSNSDKKNLAEEEEEEEPKALQVKFASNETEKSKAAKAKSFYYMQQKSATEPWLKVDFHPSWSGKSSLERLLLECQQREHDGSDIQCSEVDYMNRLIINDDASSGNDQSSSVADRIKNILLNAKVVKFEQLMEILKTTDHLPVLRTLQSIAMLVQSCWVVKSELLYPKDSFSPVTRVPAEILCKVRDFVIWKFADNPYFTRGDVPQSLKIPAEDFKTILSDVATRESDGRWKFRYEFDTEFTTNFSDVVQRQKLLWSARLQTMNKIAAGSCASANGTVIIKSEPTSPTSSQPPKRQKRKSIREDSPQKSNVKQDSKALVDPDSENGITPDLPKALAQIIKLHHCLSLSQMRNLLSATYQKVSDKVLEDAIVKVNGVFRITIKWPQNASEEPIYALIRVGDSFDKLREALLDLFSKTARIRLSAFQKKVEDELGGKSNHAEANCKKILNEYCVFKAGFYYMKGTVELDT